MCNIFNIGTNAGKKRNEEEVEVKEKEKGWLSMFKRGDKKGTYVLCTSHYFLST